MTLLDRTYRSVVRPLLFQLSAEEAHRLALATLRWDLPWRVLGRSLQVRDPRLAVEYGGLHFANPVGLAPGLDKNGTAIASLARLGFGYVVVGSITRDRRPGNRHPRLARDVPAEGILNSLGLPGRGIEAVTATLRGLGDLPVPVIASVAGFSSAELVELAAAVEPYVDAVEIGLVCPNSTESERMRELEMFDEVVAGVVGRRRKPVFIKLPSHHDEITAVSVREMVVRAADAGIDGISVSGSRTIPIPDFPSGRGSIAGRPIAADALRIDTDIAAWADGRIPIRAAGGVSSGQDAAALLEAGATAVELYSAFIFRGPGVAADVLRGLVAELDEGRAGTVRDLTLSRRDLRVPA